MARQGQHFELEAKLWVTDLAALEVRLQSAGASLQAPRVLERNVRYEDVDGSLTPAGIVLRMRQDDRARLTYKGPAEEAPSAGLQARFEAEVTVDDFDTMALILERLGYRPFMSYEKYRTTYTLAGAEVVLDELPFGHFVEVEGEAAAIEQAILILDLGNAIRFSASYGELFDYVRANLALTFHDLTFENFAGIDVPLHAFRPPER